MVLEAELATLSGIQDRPAWWDWELELSLHLRRRRKERGISEIVLRHMFERADSVHPGATEGRWRVATSHDARRWIIVVEPEDETQRLVVITAFAVD